MIPPAGGLYAILDVGTAPATEPVGLAQAALASGAAMLQLRDKVSAPARRHEHARRLLDLCCAAGVPLLINDEVALAADVGAHGVHLGQNDATLAGARQQLGADAIIGVTCHASLEAAHEAARAGASYVSFGRFFASRTKPGAPPADPSILTLARQQLSLPVVAIGGVNADNGGALIAAGADWLAVSGALFGADDVRQAAARIAGLFAAGASH